MSRRKTKYDEPEATLDDEVNDLLSSGKEPEEIVAILVKEGYNRAEIQESLQYLL